VYLTQHQLGYGKQPHEVWRCDCKTSEQDSNKNVPSSDHCQSCLWQYIKTHELQYIPHVVLYFGCFINDGIGIWLHNPDPTIDKNNWLNFQTCLNNSGLKWVFRKRSDEVVFMELQLKIEGKKIVTSLFAKPMALHLYIPLHSCHAPGVLVGMVLVTSYASINSAHVQSTL
jgi:hypothetical protein